MNTNSRDAKRLFVELVDNVPPDQWEDRLLDASAGDQQLRARVRNLLRAHADPSDFLDEPAVESDAAAYLPNLLAQRNTIGPYKLIEEIGEGGVGIVYMAEQTEPVTRRVALKIIKPGMDSRQVIARFEAERQALAVMDHPNIAKVIDAGMTDLGRPYFVMELVKGAPITQYCDAHRYNIRQRLELFTLVCQAIQHAHQKGVIHRDIKPSNVLVARYDDQTVPKVIDFGVAKATEQQLTEKTVLTQCGQIVGTPQYMSPEQAHLNQLDIDTRSDIYSLGVLLYELLTGEAAFDVKQLRGATFHEVLRIVREVDPLRPSVRVAASVTLPRIAANRQVDPTRLGSILRGELDWIVLRAMEKDRTRRYATAMSLAADIARYLSDEPVEACPPSRTYVLQKLIRRNKGVLSTVAAVVLTAFIGLSGSTLLIARGRNAAEESARREAAAASQIQERLNEARYNLYVSHIQLACQDWSDGQVHRMVKTLESNIPQGGDRDFRGWEWYYLMSLTMRGAATLTPGIGSIADVSWSADDRYLAAAGERIVVYDAETQEPQFEIPDAELFAWSPHSSELAVLSHGGDVSVWDAESRNERLRIGKIDETIKSTARMRMAWSPDGSRIAVGDGLQLYIFHVDELNAKNIVEIDRRLGAIHCFDWSPDSRYVALGGGFPGWVQVWDIGDDRSVIVQQWHGHVVTDVAWCPDGSLLASSAQTHEVVLHETRDWTHLRDLEQTESGPIDIQWSPDGEHLAAACMDGRVAVWNLKTGENEKYLRGHLGPIATLDWSNDGERMATGSADHTIKLWQLWPVQEYDLLSGHLYGTWSPTGQQCAVVTNEPDRHISILNVSSHDVVNRFPVRNAVYGLA